MASSLIFSFVVGLLFCEYLGWALCPQIASLSFCWGTLLSPISIFCFFCLLNFGWSWICFGLDNEVPPDLKIWSVWCKNWICSVKQKSRWAVIQHPVSYSSHPCHGADQNAVLITRFFWRSNWFWFDCSKGCLFVGFFFPIFGTVFSCLPVLIVNYCSHVKLWPISVLHLVLTLAFGAKELSSNGHFSLLTAFFILAFCLSESVIVDRFYLHSL